MMLKTRFAVISNVPAGNYTGIASGSLFMRTGIRKRAWIKAFLASWLLLLCVVSGAQTIRVSGTVRDSLTQAPLSNVSVYAGSGLTGTRTDGNGHYLLPISSPVSSIRFLLTGYHQLTRQISAEPVQHIDADLSRSYTQLEDVTVSSRQMGRYSNKHNPAVELIRQVIAHKSQNDIGAYPTASYEKYEKLMMYLDKFPHWIINNKLMKQYRFVFENKDTTKIPGKELTPVYLEENFSRNYFRRHPEKKNTIVIGQKKVDYGEFIDTHGISVIFNRLYEDINIYDNHIVVFTRQFISPIAESGPLFYKYFIRDTITENNQRIVQLFFMPRNPADLLFTGTLYITLDGRYAVRKLNMQTNKHINLGLIRSLTIAQDFTPDSAFRYHLSYSDVIGDFGLTRKGSGMFGERTVAITGFKSGQPIEDSLFKTQRELPEQEIRSQQDSFWLAHRADTLSHIEVKTYKNIDSLHKMKSYLRVTDYANMFLAGYKSFGPVEIGPVNTFLTYNPVEGYKPRFGGRTTTRLSKRYYLEGYTGVGLRDKEWKYFGRFTYALNNKSVYTYPLHYIRASYRKDTNIPGTDDESIDDNILFAIKRGDNTKYLYNQIFRVDYLHEFGDHISYGLGFKYKQQRAAGSLYFIKGNSGVPDTLAYMRTAELSFMLRWAPHEQFYQTKVNRAGITNRYPIFTFGYTRGIKGLFGGQYNYNNFSLNIFKRFYLAPIGYSDVSLSGGYVTGKLPWPLMIIHTGNQGFIYSGSSFNMMNYLEFVSDHFASLSVDHYFKGFFFNRIPLLKRLKLREVVAGKILFGGVRPENRPDAQNGQVLFPVTNNAVVTYALNKRPYFEASAGITHIFKVLRVDLIRRFTYLNHPDITKWGVRASFNLEL